MLLCSRPSEDRTIPLSVIAERTKLSIEDVEHLLMKSLSVSSFWDGGVYCLHLLFYFLILCLIDGRQKTQVKSKNSNSHFQKI